MQDFSGEERQAMATVAGSDGRRAVLTALARDGPETPGRLTEAVPVSRSTVSRALGTLREAGCVELVVPEDTEHGRLYAATELGETVAEVVGDGD